MNDQRRKSEQNQVNSVANCPACGWRIDSEAYRCPKCHIYFCFKCRARIKRNDPQYQCMNQSCTYYGKLVCEACTEMVPQFRQVDDTVEITLSQPITEPNWVFLIIVIIVFAILAILFLLYQGIGFLSALFWGGFITPIVLTFLIGSQIKWKRCCIKCSSPVKKLR